MKMYGLQPTMAAALGVCLIGGDMVHAQGTGDDRMQFRMVGADAKDKELRFSK